MRIERKTAGNVTILSLAGAIDDDSVRVVAEKADAAVEAGSHRVILSLGDVRFFDSTVLGRLTTASQRLRDANGEVVISASPSTRQAFSSLGLPRTARVFPNIQAALAYFGTDERFGRGPGIGSGTTLGGAR